MLDSVMFGHICFSCRVSETEFSDTTLVTKVKKCGQATLVEQVEGRLDYEVTIQQKVVTRNLRDCQTSRSFLIIVRVSRGKQCANILPLFC